ncbi:MAG: FkbM family methyltransferase, partial [Solirubrobacterales bacterium]
LMKWFVGTPVARAIWKIPGSQRLYTSLISRLRPDKVTIDGHTINLDETDSLLLSVNGEYEAAELKLFRDCIESGASVLDIGGHIGLYTLQAARAVGDSGRVTTFEPAPGNFALLERNVAENGYSNVTLVNRAVSDSAGEQILFVSADNTGDHRLGDSAGGREGVSVETVTIDGYFGGDYPRVDVIKMDIQGSEPRALTGMRSLLDANDEIIFFTELSPEHLGPDGVADYVSAIADAGFSLRELDEDSGAVEPADASQLVERLRTAGPGQHTNLVCVKGAAAGTRLDRALAVTPTAA